MASPSALCSSCDLWRSCKARLVGRPTKDSIAEGDRLRHLELVTNTRRELDQVARPLSLPKIVASAGADLEAGAGARLELIVMLPQAIL